VIGVDAGVGPQLRVDELQRHHRAVYRDDGAAVHALTDPQAHPLADGGVQVGPDSQSHAVTVGRDGQDREVDGGN
jgi:hypothetical protein